MPVTVDATSSGSSGMTHTCSGTNRLLILIARRENQSTCITAASFGGASMTQLGSDVTIGGGCALAIWYLIAPTTTANSTLTMTGSGAVGALISVTGAAQSSPFPAGLVSSSGITSGGTISISMTAASGELVVGDGYSATGGEFVSGGTRIGTTGVAQYKTGSGSQTLTWTVNNDVDFAKALVMASPAVASAGYTLTAAKGTFTETGNTAGLNTGRKTISAQGSFAETGIAATLKAARILPSAKGTFTETGNAAGLYKGYKVIATQGSFSLTGIAAGLVATHNPLTVAPGSFTETGNAAGLYKGFNIVAATGVFTETGLAANLLATRLLAGAKGTFTETGNAANLLKGYTVIAATGVFTETGNSANLLFGHKLACANGVFALTGNAAGLNRGREIAAATGSFAETGIAANLKATRLISCNVGPFVLTGNAAGLTKSGGNSLLAATGIFTQTGQAANLLKSFKTIAAQGSFTETGNAATLKAARKLTSDVGGFTLTGRAAVLTKSFPLSAATGTFAQTGQAAGLRANRVLQATYSAFTFTGRAATLNFSNLVTPAGRNRTVIVQPIPTITLRGNMGSIFTAIPSKDPAAIEDYSIEWKFWLGSATLSQSSWTLPAGITIISNGKTDTISTVRISGGVAGETYLVTNKVTASDGREEVQSFNLRVDTT